MAEVKPVVILIEPARRMAILSTPYFLRVEKTRFDRPPWDASDSARSLCETRRKELADTAVLYARVPAELFHGRHRVKF